MVNPVTAVSAYVYVNRKVLRKIYRPFNHLSVFLLSQYSELDDEENKLEVRLFDKQ